jgi:hypothetical protein
MKVELKGHICSGTTGLPLCGAESRDTPFQKLKLFGEICPDCYEAASRVLRGEKISKKDLTRLSVVV